MKRQIPKKEKTLLVIILSMITLLCLCLWYVRHYYRVNDMVRIQSESGVFDVTGIDFSKHFTRLEGEVSYLPGILTPQEFTAREKDAVIGNPWYIPCATSRIRIKVPDNSAYMITTSSIDFAHQVYIDGELRFQAGVPAQTKEDFVPSYGQMTLEITPKNGTIEIIQQGANFVHREGGGHSNIYLGKARHIQRFLSLIFGPEYITAGLFAALFLIHLVLFIMRRSYKANLLFSLLCFTWMVRTGVTGAKVFYAMFPSLPWQLAFRAEYLCLPAASILMVLLAQYIFPTVPQKWFIRTVAVVSAGFSILCITLNTVLLSKSLIIYEAFFTLAILYLIIRFIMKVTGLVKSGQFEIEQSISLIGFSFFITAAVNDALYFANVFDMLGFTIAFAMTGLAMLIFSFFQMTAMFYGTMKETALAHEMERKAQADKEMLAEMNRLKSAFYADMSHEMKTPLTVIAVNAQFAAQNIGAGAIDDETVTDLNAISAEARRLAQMVTSLVGIGRMQGTTGERMPLDLGSLIKETARIYQSLFARKDNTLSVICDSELPPVDGNADQLIQVLINLLSNANRHTKGGQVSIKANISSVSKCMESDKPKEGNLKNTAESNCKYITVTVTDSGEGIDQELLPHVFERYCHGENGGSGLGLCICKSIINDHGGTIDITSQPGKGTKVWFNLPVIENGERTKEN